VRRLLRTIAAVIAVVPIIDVPCESALAASQADNKAQAEFEALLTRVKQSDPSVSFLQLRRLYAESDSYQPYRDDAEQPMIAAAGAKQFETALKIARETGGMLGCVTRGVAWCYGMPRTKICRRLP
jgi:hypothetical protein